MTYPESLLSAARAVNQCREDRMRRPAQSTWSYLHGGDSRPSEIMVAEDLAERAKSRRAREIEAHYERELAAYEASLKEVVTGGDR